MATNLEKLETKVMHTFKLSDTEGDKARYKDNIAWWMNQYKAIIATEAEDAVRNAATIFNDSIALRDNAVNVLVQFDEDVMETEREITRLGGIAFIEQLQPTIKERKAYLDNLFESLTQKPPARRWKNP